MSTPLAERVEGALEGLGRHELFALRRRERDGASYSFIAAELDIRREVVADLLVSARLAIAERLEGEEPPPRLTKQCGPARRVIAAQQDGETVSVRDLERASEHVDDCDACRAARLALQEARLACRAWSAAPPAPPGRDAPGRVGARRRGRVAALVAGIALLLVVAIVALGGSGDEEAGVPPPVAPTPAAGSAEATEERDEVPPPGEEFCLPDEPGCE